MSALAHSAANLTPPMIASAAGGLFATGFRAMGGSNEIRVAGLDEAAAGKAVAAAIAEVRRIEAKYSRYRADSIVSRINTQAGSTEPVICDDETLWLLDCADGFHKLSGGLFDITSGVLRRAWSFAKAELPSPEDLAPLLALIGWERIERSPSGVRLPKAGMEIDLGGIGKEYAADRAARVLRAAGCRHGYVNLGGDITVVGPQPDGRAWPIGVEHPRQRGTVAAHIAVRRGGLTTSGDSERFIEVGGKRYCHILNPKTGMPAAHWASISIQAPSTLAAGALSTIAMLKEHDGLAFLESLGCAFLAFDRCGNTYTNQSDMREYTT